MWKRILVLAVACGMVLQAADAFKITFGQKARGHGRSWSGGIRDAGQVKRITGWHLGVEDEILPPARWKVVLRLAGGLVTPKGVIVELGSLESAPVTFNTRYGDFSFVPAEIPYGVIHEIADLRGDVTVERVPAPVTVTGREQENDDPALLKTRGGESWLAWVGYRTVRREGHRIEGGDRVFVARSGDGGEWSVPEAITPVGDHFRVALGEDSEGRVWCVYGEQKEVETGNFDLYGRRFDGSQWSAEERLTSSRYPDVFHRMAGDAEGRLYLVWMGYRQRPDDPLPQSEVLLRVLTEEGWSAEQNLSQSAHDDWWPAVAAASGGAWVAWDAYRSTGGGPANYDVLVRPVVWKGGSYLPGAVQAVASSPLAEMSADVAVDGEQRVWVSWEEGGANWGKDTGYENPRHGIYLRPGGAEIYRPVDRKTGFARRPRVAVREGGNWRQPVADITASVSGRMNRRLLQGPRLAVDGGGSLRVILRHQLAARGRNTGHLFDLYETSLAAGGWRPLTLLSLSTGRQDTVGALASGEGGGWAVAVGTDGRRLPVGLPEHHSISVLQLPGAVVPASIETAALELPEVKEFRPTHPNEKEDVARIRGYRIKSGDEAYRIIRGDLHRHSEISMDGATDGSLWDLYRYAINAASMDFFAVTDHNYGAWLDTDEPESANTDDVYQWWRTQKSADIFHVPGRFVPLYGYERSVNFPLGHVNIFHPRRGVFTFRVGKLHVMERPDTIEKDARGLAAYLKATGGVGVSHTSGSIMGTDWKYLDDSVVPMVEIYQGDRNSYEAEGAPRAALPDATGLGWAGRQPFQKGLVRNALGAGFRLGFIASSDHYSTHISYANLIVPAERVNRKEIQSALVNRRGYASTDNIVLDFRAGEVLQGSAMEASESPTFEVKVVGTEAVMRVDVVKNNRVLYTHRPDGPVGDRKQVSFTFRDAETFDDTSMGPTSQIENWADPETGVRARVNQDESYYYVRVLQSFSAAELEKEGEVAWSSPIFVRRIK